MKKLSIGEGYKFTNFTVLKEVDRGVQPSGGTYRRFECECICGKVKTIRAAHISRSNINSCGCLSKTKSIGNESDKYIRKIWRAIKYRCQPNYMESHLYYDKGVSVCDEWLYSFDSFLGWARENGLKKGLQIDREDGNGNYCPDNCRVVTPLVNCNNRVNTTMVMYDGKEVSLSLLLHQQGKHKNYAAIRTRLLRGWDHQKAIDTPIRKGNYWTGKRDSRAREENQLQMGSSRVDRNTREVQAEA